MQDVPGKPELLSQKDGLHPSAQGSLEFMRLISIALGLPHARRRQRLHYTINFPYSKCQTCHAAGHNTGDCSDYWK